MEKGQKLTSSKQGGTGRRGYLDGIYKPNNAKTLEAIHQEEFFPVEWFLYNHQIFFEYLLKENKVLDLVEELRTWY